jgi:hypothetical protein
MPVCGERRRVGKGGIDRCCEDIEEEEEVERGSEGEEGERSGGGPKEGDGEGSRDETTRANSLLLPPPSLSLSPSSPSPPPPHTPCALPSPSLPSSPPPVELSLSVRLSRPSPHSPSQLGRFRRACRKGVHRRPVSVQRRQWTTVELSEGGRTVEMRRIRLSESLNTDPHRHHTRSRLHRRCSGCASPRLRCGVSLSRGLLSASSAGGSSRGGCSHLGESCEPGKVNNDVFRPPIDARFLPQSKSTLLRPFTSASPSFLAGVEERRLTTFASSPAELSPAPSSPPLVSSPPPPPSSPGPSTSLPAPPLVLLRRRTPSFSRSDPPPLADHPRHLRQRRCHRRFRPCHRRCWL